MCRADTDRIAVMANFRVITALSAEGVIPTVCILPWIVREIAAVMIVTTLLMIVMGSLAMILMILKLKIMVVVTVT